MAVTVERVASSAEGNVNNPTLSAQVDAANDVLVSVFGYRANDLADITAVTRNAQAQTILASADDADTQGGVNPEHRLEVWMRNNPSTGTADIVGTNSQFKVTAMGYLVFAGADTVDPIPAADVVVAGDFTAPSTTISATVPNMASGDLAVLCVLLGSWDDSFNDTSGATVTDGASQTRHFAQFGDTPAGGVARIVATSKTGTGNVGLSVSVSAANIYGTVAFRVKAAGGGGGPSAGATRSQRINQLLMPE